MRHMSESFVVHVEDLDPLLCSSGLGHAHFDSDHREASPMQRRLDTLTAMWYRAEMMGLHRRAPSKAKSRSRTWNVACEQSECRKLGLLGLRATNTATWVTPSFMPSSWDPRSLSHSCHKSHDQCHDSLNRKIEGMHCVRTNRSRGHRPQTLELLARRSGLKGDLRS